MLKEQLTQLNSILDISQKLEYILEYYQALKDQLFITQDDKNKTMIAINLNTAKNILKIAILATLTYLVFSTVNNRVIPYVNYIIEDTTTTPPVYPF
jgi:hypothetical protein